MVARNDVTGDAISTKVNSQAYMDNYDLIFGKKTKIVVEPEVFDEFEKVLDDDNSNQKLKELMERAKRWD